MEIYPETDLTYPNPSGVTDLATLSEESLPPRIDQLDITDPGWRNLLQPPDQDAPHGYKEEVEVGEVIVEF
jgi:hypothetical protein